MKTFNVRFLVLAAALCVTGCAGKEASLAGHYEGSYLPAKGMEKGAEARHLQEIASHTTLDLNPDQTFAMGGESPGEGYWSFANDQVEIRTTKMMGKVVKTPSMYLYVGPSGSLSMAGDYQDKDGTLTFTKKHD